MTTAVSPSTHKLWGGRFAGGPAPEFDALNNSIDIDFRLWPFDIELSKAWAMGLYNAGILTLAECSEIEQGLDGVAARLAARALSPGRRASGRGRPSAPGPVDRP